MIRHYLTAVACGIAAAVVVPRVGHAQMFKVARLTSAATAAPTT